MNRRLCPICGSGKNKKMVHIDMNTPEEWSITGKYDVVVCDNCGFAYADVASSQSNYDKYYADHNAYSKVDDLRYGSDNYEKEEVYFCRLKDYLKPESHILDLGCGSGKFVVYLNHKGWVNSYGLDPSFNSVERLIKQGLHGIQGSICEEISKEKQQQFDVVCCNGVLEHIYDVKMASRTISDYLKENGVAFIAVPAVEGFGERYAQLPNYFNQEHINYFSLNTLDRLMASVGLRRVSSDNESYYPGASDDIDEEKTIIAVYIKKDGNCILPRDNKTEESIKAYLMEQRRRSDLEKAGLVRWLNEQENIIIWGGGAYGMSLLTNIDGLYNKTLYFVDSNHEKEGQSIDGKFIRDPKILFEEKNQFSILIACMRNAYDIRRSIEDMGIKCSVYQA